jgi:hypothetical protein
LCVNYCHIGALELGDQLESHGDRVLEAAVLNANPTQLALRCTQPGHCVSDGALESAGLTLISGPTFACSMPRAQGGNC